MRMRLGRKEAREAQEGELREEEGRSCRLSVASEMRMRLGRKKAQKAQEGKMRRPYGLPIGMAFDKRPTEFPSAHGPGFCGPVVVPPA